ncbi:NAD(P)/FAD-dependent oxidoreductase [Methylococcus sp. EFPC2]|uniref:FAD-dependent oxidoreductase n=1 Tax=Methylococcus sp. EFPC2 TaxID=2812648 RepID=UPI001968A0DD|nr:NAD(P)/FAD-dependent oxidoreductase [Methylococcus sp. EFPC2]QSA98169.1 FAD-dependent monooxygenase [Methylococcus sp. EFPC2]
MNDRNNVDVLIAGGGVAGVAAAAALSQLGLHVLIVEPLPAQGRRLAGELIHPPGIEGLRELGLLDDELGAVVKGFAIFPGVFRDDPNPMLLPYASSGDTDHCGRAIEHQVLKEHLLDKARRLPGVDSWLGARVTGMEGGADRPFTALVQYEGREQRVSARLILGADGPMSQVRKMVGIGHRTQRYSGMMGVEVEDTHLPHAEYGNIFLNPAGVAYAYGIGGGRARVMLEVLKDADSRESIRSHLSFFPEVFCKDIERVLAAGKPLAAANYCIIPEASVRGNFALIGDARGCCHPLTASGITAAVKDALILRDALRESRLDVRAALQRYSRVCGRLELTRRTLAEELREAFLAQTPEDLLLHQCIFSYWRTSPQGRVRSMALLSTLDSSIFSLAAQYTMVALHAFRLLPRWLRRKALGNWNRGMLKLLLKSLVFQQTAISQWFKEHYAKLGAPG